MSSELCYTARSRLFPGGRTSTRSGKSSNIGPACLLRVIVGMFTVHLKSNRARAAFETS